MDDHTHTIATSTGAVKLQTQLCFQPDSLDIRYVVSNGESSDIYLFNRLVRTAPDGSGKVDANLAYVWFEPGPTAHIGKCLQPVPPNLQVAQREIPYLTRVAAGGQFVESIKIELPLVESHPYKSMLPAKVSGTAVEEIRSLRFEIGFLLYWEGMLFLEFTENDEQIFAFRSPFDALGKQRLLKVGPLEQPLRALLPNRLEPSLTNTPN